MERFDRRHRRSSEADHGKGAAPKPSEQKFSNGRVSEIANKLSGSEIPPSHGNSAGSEPLSPPKAGSIRKKSLSPEPRVPPCRSVFELLRRAYDPGAKRRLGVSKGEQAAVAEGPCLTETERDEILLLAREDTTLERTRELLLLLAEGSGLGAASATVRSFVGNVLRQHPAFRHETLVASIEAPIPELQLQETARALYTLILKSLLRSEVESAFPKKVRQRCRRNAFHCLLLWWREDHGLSVTDLQRLLLATCWGELLAGQKTETKRLRTLFLSRDPDAAAVAMAGMQDEAVGWARRTDVARQTAAELRGHVADLQGKIASLTEDLERERQDGQATFRTLQAERQEWVHERSHRVDQYEALKGRVLHRLKKEAGLLDEGLQALRRNPPKVHVMDDHAERAIEGLKREIELIREEQG